MLPKPEKISKKSSTEQLDLVDTIDEVDKAKKKRLSIIIFLLLTVGLSFCFIIYRQVKTINFQQIKLPNLSIKLPTLPQSKFSPTVPENWSISVKTVGSTAFSYSSNLGALPDLNLFKTIHDPSYSKKYLPNGVIVSEKTISNQDNIEILSLISTPKIKFEIYTKIPGKISPTETDTFAHLVETFYWHLLK